MARTTSAAVLAISHKFEIFLIECFKLFYPGRYTIMCLKRDLVMSSSGDVERHKKDRLCDGGEVSLQREEGHIQKGQVGDCTLKYSRIL